MGSHFLGVKFIKMGVFWEIMDITALPLFEPMSLTNVDFGAEGYVYRSLDSRAIKVPLAPFNEYLARLENENTINYRLYYGGVAVPQPVGLFKIAASSFPLLPSFYENSGYVPALVREFVSGKEYKDLTDVQKVKAESLHRLEINKAKQLGIIPFGDARHASNCFYEQEGDFLTRAVLIDFGFWKKRSE